MSTERQRQPGITWGTVLVNGVVLRAYRDEATGTVSYLRPPLNYRLAAYALAQTFRADSDADARVWA